MSLRPSSVEINVGDTLSNIAAQYLEDYSQWRKIAEKNDIDIFSSDSLSIGEIIEIPSISELADELPEAVRRQLDLSGIKRPDNLLNERSLISWIY